MLYFFKGRLMNPRVFYREEWGHETKNNNKDLFTPLDEM